MSAAVALFAMFGCAGPAGEAKTESAMPVAMAPDFGGLRVMGDFNGDGKVDLCAASLSGEARLLVNVTP